MVRSFAVEIARQELKAAVHRLTTQNAILQIENRGFMAARSNEKKKGRRGKTVIEEIRAEGHYGGIFWSPTKIDRARIWQQQKDNEAAQHKATMATK